MKTEFIRYRLWGLVKKLFGQNQSSLSGLSSLFTVMPEIKFYLKKDKQINFLYFDIKNFTHIENVYGWEICYRILMAFAQMMLDWKKKLEETGSKVEVIYGGGDDFILLVFSTSYLETEIDQLCISIKNSIITELKKTTYPTIDLHYSYTLIKSDGNENIEHLIYRELKAVSLKAKDHQYRAHLEKKNIMQDIIVRHQVYPVYQPIISLRTGDVFGREALTRGEKDIGMNPTQLFGLARETGMLLKFERLVREMVIKGGMKRQPGEKLFINLTPEIVNELNFRRGETHRFLREYQFVPEDIVFEITENHAIKDFKLFRKVVEHYRAQGYKIAVDDAGSGFSTLQVIAELYPDFIKIDMSLIRDLDKTPIKLALVEALVDFSKKTGAQLIAEGIETIAELECLLELGIEYGQGYLIARPGDIETCPEGRIIEIVKKRSKVRELEKMMGNSQLKDIVEFNQAITQDILVKDMVDMFDEFPGIQGVVVIDKAQKPVGLVMKDRLYYKLGSAFGVALFMKRPIFQLMDCSPLIVDIYTNLHTVAKIAMERDSKKLYDYIIVTKDEKYYGTISVRSLLEKINQMQIELARDANPLTGLPGNKQIERELNFRLSQQTPFGVIYADLDHFKEVNDSFGYEIGDEILLIVANICKNTTNGFVGHIGGDDFILITEVDWLHEVAENIIKSFDEKMKIYFAEKGFFPEGITVKSRKGKKMTLTGVSISLASGIYNGTEYSNCYEVSKDLALLKGKAKGVTGSSHWHRDTNLSVNTEWGREKKRPV